MVGEQGTDPLLLLLAAANSTASSSAGNSTSIAPSFVGWINGFVAELQALIAELNAAALDIGRAAFSFLIIAGALLWFSRANRHVGKDLLAGGIFIAVFIEFVAPWLSTFHLP